MAGQEPTRWVVSSETPPELRALLEAAQNEGPTIAQKATLAAKLGLPAAGVFGGLGIKAALIGAGVLAGAAGVGLAVMTTSPRDGETRRRVVHETAADDSQDESTVTPSEVAVPEARVPGDVPLAQDRGTDGNDEQRGTEGAEDQAEERGTDGKGNGEQTEEQGTRKRGATEHRPRRSNGAVTAKKPSEVSLIRSARAAVDGNPERALSLTQTHERLYPSGLLVQEREVIAIEALKTLGKAKDAQDKARSFRQQHPGSGHRPDVE